MSVAWTKAQPHHGNDADNNGSQSHTALPLRRWFPASTLPIVLIPPETVETVISSPIPVPSPFSLVVSLSTVLFFSSGGYGPGQVVSWLENRHRNAHEGELTFSCSFYRELRPPPNVDFVHGAYGRFFNTIERHVPSCSIANAWC